MRWILRLQQLIRGTTFPYVVKDYMLSIKWTMARHDNKPLPLMAYFRDDVYVRYQAGQVVPFKEQRGWLAYYRITNIRKPYGDYAGFDDGRLYNLALDHVERAPGTATKEGR